MTFGSFDCKCRRGRLSVLAVAYSEFVRALWQRYRGNKAIPSSAYGLNEPGIRGGVTERLTKLADCSADAPLKIDEGILRPQFAAQFFPGDHATGLVQQHRKNPEGKILKRDMVLPFPQFGSVEICGVEAE